LENSINKYKKGSLVIYHNSPAIITSILDDKITLMLKNKKTKKVRLKDIVFLYSGPVSDFKELDNKLDEDIESALELIDEETVNIDDLAEFIYGEVSAPSLWKTWILLQEKVYFYGDLNEIKANSKETINKILSEREEKERGIKEWSDYIERVKNKLVNESDLIKLREVESLAFGHETNNRTMKAINQESTPLKAHQLLLRLDLWSDKINPYPKRFNCALQNPEFDIPESDNGKRIDLTALETYAIDSEHTKDPDDAVSFDGEYLWVHIADVASMIVPDSEIDLESRGRGSTLYLPEKSINMIPLSIVEKLGLGLSEKSVALSFKIKINDDGKPVCEKITPSLIKVKRISYNEADNLMENSLFSKINNLVDRFNKRRANNGSMDIILPEADISVNNLNSDNIFGKESCLKINSSKFVSEMNIKINKIEMTKSRKMVATIMLLTNEAVAQWLYENNIPAPYVSQNAPEEIKQPKTLAQTISYLKTFQKSKLSLNPSIHAGLGLDKYVRTTSPLRRYSDLLVHQQIRAFLLNKDLISSDQVEEKMNEAEFTAYNCTMASRLSSRHWKLIYIKQLENKEFDGVLIDKRGGKGIVLIPELAIEAKVLSVGSIDLDSEFKIMITDINIPKLELFAKIIKT